MTKDSSSTPFELPTENSGFSSRSKDIFAGLDSVEKTHDKKQKDLEDSPGAKREQRKLWKDEPDVDVVVGESLPFKRPSIAPRGGPDRGGHKRNRKPYQKTPDHVQHPEKWKRYSLEDCDTSESSNSRAAFAFLEERRKLRDAEENKKNEDWDVSDGKIVFKKPTKTADHSSKAVVKRAKLEEISIGHLASESDSSTIDELAGNTSVDDHERSKPPSSEKVSFKKGNRKKNLRVREEDD